MLKAQSERRCCVDPGASGHLASPSRACCQRQRPRPALGDRNGPGDRAGACPRKRRLKLRRPKPRNGPWRTEISHGASPGYCPPACRIPGRGGRDRQTIPGASEAIARLRSADVAGLPERRTQWPRGRRLDQNGPRCGNNGVGWARARGHSCAAWWHEESRAPVGAAHGGRATTLFSDLPMT
jgi:hypothetical protein